MKLFKATIESHPVSGDVFVLATTFSEAEQAIYRQHGDTITRMELIAADAGHHVLLIDAAARLKRKHLHTHIDVSEGTLPPGVTDAQSEVH